MYGLIRNCKVFTTVPNAFNTDVVSSEVCSWKANNIPSISFSSNFELISATPWFKIIFSIVSIKILLYCSFSSLSSGSSFRMISAPPTFKAISAVVSTSYLLFFLSRALRRSQKFLKKSGMISSLTNLTETPSVATVYFMTFNTIFFISSSFVVNSLFKVGIKWEV